MTPADPVTNPFTDGFLPRSADDIDDEEAVRAALERNDTGERYLHPQLLDIEPVYRLPRDSSAVSSFVGHALATPQSLGEPGIATQADLLADARFILESLDFGLEVRAAKTMFNRAAPEYAPAWDGPKANPSEMLFNGSRFSREDLRRCTAVMSWQLAVALALELPGEPTPQAFCNALGVSKVLISQTRYDAMNGFGIPDFPYVWGPSVGAVTPLLLCDPLARPRMRRWTGSIEGTTFSPNRGHMIAVRRHPKTGPKVAIFRFETPVSVEQAHFSVIYGRLTKEPDYRSALSRLRAFQLVA